MTQHERHQHEAKTYPDSTDGSPRYKVWLAIEDMETGEDIQEFEACAGIGARATLAEAIELLEAVHLRESEYNA